MGNIMDMVRLLNNRKVPAISLDGPIKTSIDPELFPYRQVLAQTADAVLIADTNGVIKYVNTGFETVTGYKADEVIGQHPNVLKSGEHDALFYAHFWNTLRQGRDFRGVFINRRKDGRIFHEEKTVSPIRNAAGQITHYASTGRDISARIAAEQALYQLAHYDSLTRLPNRNLFFELLQKAYQCATRKNQRVAVIFLDIDNLKSVNDVLGHDVGDQALQIVVERLALYLKPRGTITRWGGDEFAVLVEGIEQIDAVKEITQGMLNSLSTPLRIGMKHISLSACVGTAIWPNDADDPADLVRHANFAMHRAKAMGPNSNVFYCKSTREAIQAAFLLEGELHGALERSEFHLVFQPVVQSGTAQMIGVEALLRWQSPTHGSISPSQFIPLLERSGLIVPVGRWVMATACLEVMKLSTRCPQRIRLAVNVSARQLLNPDFFNDVNDALGQSGLEPERLELEITESVLIENPDAVEKVLRRLRVLGVRIATDDFGTGYSSLAYLHRFPINTLKIDQSFVAVMDSNADALAIVRSIIRLAKSLDLEIVAEGVETAGQAQRLTELGCSFLQGYWFSRPVVIDQLPSVDPLIA